jgi:hypothetical protein
MIGTLIDQGKSVLFVSEKIVALEVVRDRLASRGLDPFALELHSHKAVRREVAKELGSAVQMRPVAPARPAAERLEQARLARAGLSDYALAMNETRQPLALSMFDVLGRIATIDARLSPPPSKLALDTLNPSSLTKLLGTIDGLGKHWNSALEGDRALWAGLQNQPSSVFDFRSALDSLQSTKTLEPATSDTANLMGLAGLQSLRRLHDLLLSWQQRPQGISTAWLGKDLATLSDAIETLTQLHGELQQATATVNHSAGARWRELPNADLEASPTLDLWKHLDIERDDLTIARLGTITEYLTEANALLRTLQVSSRVLSDHFGLTAPTTPASYRVHIEAVGLLLGDAAPLAAWLTDPQNYMHAREGLDRLTQCVAEERAAKEEASVVFTEGVLALDLQTFTEELPVGAGLLKRLSPGYRRARDTVAEFAHPTIDARQLPGAPPACTPLAQRSARP